MLLEGGEGRRKGLDLYYFAFQYGIMFFVLIYFKRLSYRALVLLDQMLICYGLIV